MTEKEKRRIRFKKQLPDDLDLTETQMDIILSLLEKVYNSGKNAERIKNMKEDNMKCESAMESYRNSRRNNITFYD